MGDLKKLVKKLVVVCVGLVAFGFLVVAPSEAGETTVIKSKSSGTFVTTNFDFDHPDLSTPAAYINTGGIDSAGVAFTGQGVNEMAPDGNPCTVPGGVAGAGTEFTLVADVSVSRNTATGDLLFTKATSATECDDFSTFPTPPFPLISTETGVVTGGTGKNSGATGTFTVKAKGAFLALPATTGAGAFGWIESTVVTTVTVP